MENVGWGGDKEMIVRFCDIDGGNVLLEQERNDIADLMAIFRTDSEFNLYYSKEQFYNGKFVSSTLSIEASKEFEGVMNDILYLYFDIRSDYTMFETN